MFYFIFIKNYILTTYYVVLCYTIFEGDCMTSAVNILVDSEDKEKASIILKSLGLNMTTYINMAIKQLIYKDGVPFEIINKKEEKDVLDVEVIKGYIKKLLKEYNADKAILFGSYARNEAEKLSDIDVIVYGGKNFRPTSIFAFGEDLRELTGKDVDCFEISEVEEDSDFYRNAIKEGITIK